MTTFGQVVQDQRVLLDLSKNELASKTDLSVEYIRLIELGIRHPSLSAARKILLAVNLEHEPVLPNRIRLLSGETFEFVQTDSGRGKSYPEGR